MAGRPHKDAHRKHTAQLRLMLTPEMRSIFDEAAERAGQSLSDWARTRLLEAARRETPAAEK